MRLPCGLVNLRWEHVNWSEGKLLITSPKTKRYGKHQRRIPFFPRLETELKEHFELTGAQSEFVIEDIALRSKRSNLRTTFHRIREWTGIPIFPGPFRNLRLSAANDICRAGFTMKVLTEWFGHDMATALKQYHQVMPADFERARSVAPFKQAEKATPALPRMGKHPLKKALKTA
ncbi:MAG: tyrosine-type recombinase/integrase [Rubripirellula sp.]